MTVLYGVPHTLLLAGAGDEVTRAVTLLAVADMTDEEALASRSFARLAVF